jgi:very-short-patch-repair endonuclease/predicted Zn-ribbon and HTH transcriptional regulator
MKKLTKQIFLSKLSENHKNNCEYSQLTDDDFNLGVNSKLKIICKNHGEFTQSARQHIKSKLVCPSCLSEFKQQPKTSKDYILNEFYKIHNTKYEYNLTEDFYKIKDKIDIVCPIHGKFQQVIGDHLDGKGCKKCGYAIVSEKLTNVPSEENYLKNKFIEIHNNKYDYCLIAKWNRSSYETIICPIHGKFQQTLSNHLAGKGCKKCADENVGIQKRITKEEFIKRSNIIHQNKYDYSLVDFTKYNDISYKVKIICPIHGEFTKSVANHMNSAQGCRKCSCGGSSSEELRLLDKFPGIFEHGNRSIIAPQEIDLYSDKHKLGIEVNGLYWHSNIDKNYHINKTNKCIEKDIQLLHFWDSEVNTKFDIVTSIISNKLKLNQSKIFARNCQIKEISSKEAKEFLDKNHLQGYSNSSIKIGLFYYKELISVMTFGKPRFNKNYEYELLRFCNKLNTSVIGGASKLFSYFLKNYFQHGEKIVSYANIRISDGGLYHKLGFIEKEKTDPNYFYFKSNRIYTRYQCQKSKLPKLLGDEFNSNLTEKENMNNNDYKIVYDCGNYVFEYS